MAHKNVDVRVILHRPGSPTDYHFESHDLPIDADNVIYFSNCGKRRGFMVHYLLNDSDNPGFRFPTRASHGADHLEEALWVTSEGSCPEEASTWEVFEARDVRDQGRELVVWNRNAVAQRFAYTLRVVRSGDWLRLDPPGDNQNGGIGRFESLAGGIITGMVVGLGAAALSSNALDASSALFYALGGALVGLIVGLVIDRF